MRIVARCDIYIVGVGNYFMNWSIEHVFITYEESFKNIIVCNVRTKIVDTPKRTTVEYGVHL
jgi:hypothetical protein